MPKASVPCVPKGASSVVKMPPLLRKKPWRPPASRYSPTIWPASVDAKCNGSSGGGGGGIIERGEGAGTATQEAVGLDAGVGKRPDDLACIVDVAGHGAAG